MPLRLYLHRFQVVKLNKMLNSKNQKECDILMLIFRAQYAFIYISSKTLQCLVKALLTQYLCCKYNLSLVPLTFNEERIEATESKVKATGTKSSGRKY